MEQQNRIPVEEHGYGKLRARFHIPAERLRDVIDQVSACGWHDCGDKYSIRRQHEKELMRHHFLLIYTLNGCGEAIVEGEKYHLTAKTLMIFPKSSRHSYKTQQDGRWIFYWMHIGGAHCSALLEYLMWEHGRCIMLSCEEKIRQHMEALIDSALRHEAYDLFAAKVVSNMLFDIIETAHSPNYTKRAPRSVAHRIVEIIERDDSLSIAQIAQRLYLSPEHIIRTFKKEIGITPHQYIRQLRLERACIYLKESDMSVAQIAAAAGYCSVSSFIVQFKRVYGITPKAYRSKE